MTSGLFEKENRKEGDTFYDQKFEWVNIYPAPVLITGKDGVILGINSAFTHLTGFSFSEISGNLISDILTTIGKEDYFSAGSVRRNAFVKSLKSLRNSEGCQYTVETVKQENGTELGLFHLYPLNAISDSMFDNEIEQTPDDQRALLKETGSELLTYYQNILASIPELVVLTDSDANVIGVNQASGFPVSISGISSQGRNLLDVLPPRAAGQFTSFCKSAGPGSSTRFEDQFSESSHNFTFEFRLNCVDDNRFLLIIRDISKASADENALAQSHGRLNQMLAFSEAGSWDITFGESNKVHTWNFFEILGIRDIPERELNISDINHYELVHSDDSERVKATIESAISNREDSYKISYRINDSSGKTRHLNTEAHLEFNDEGKLHRWSGIIQDVTSTRKAERLKAAAFQISQLIHSQHNLEHLMQAIHQIIASLMPAPNLLIALSSDNEAKIHFPYCSDPAGAPDAESASKGLIGYVLKTGNPLVVSDDAINLMETEGIISPQQKIPVSWLGVPLNTHSQVLGVLVLQSYSRDFAYGEDEKNILIFVSEQIALSIQRIRSDEALLRAKNQAEESSRLKSSLLANMSHELRTPMTGILGFSEILTEELEDNRYKVMASTIFKSANRLMSTLNSIMDLSAIEANIDSLKITTVSIKSVFLPQLRNLHAIASDKGIYLRTALPPSIQVLADEKLLGQLLHHLLDNAIKFTIDGGVSVSAYLNDANKQEAIIRVSDTGIGIAPEHHKMIFEEFRQVSEGMSRTFEGSGLGLALCTKISRLINARLWVDSVPGKGSDFYIGLPAAAQDYAEVVAEKEHTTVINTQRLGRGPVPEILIVEDNEINRRLAALYLRELCNTEMAENGYVALEKIRRKKYDAILMDINLGAGPNGMSIANQVRSIDQYKDVPIIAVTGYTMQGDREKLLANGCSHYLAKPYDKKTLLRLFTDILYA